MKKKTYQVNIGLGVLFKKGLIQNPIPAMRFAIQEFDKRQWWLEIYDGTNIYFTSINKSRWRKMDNIAKAGIINYAKYKLVSL